MSYKVNLGILPTLCEQSWMVSKRGNKLRLSYVAESNHSSLPWPEHAPWRPHLVTACSDTSKYSLATEALHSAVGFSIASPSRAYAGKIGIQRRLSSVVHQHHSWTLSFRLKYPSLSNSYAASWASHCKLMRRHIYVTCHSKRIQVAS